jgi:hypothetical protein
MKEFTYKRVKRASLFMADGPNTTAMSFQKAQLGYKSDVSRALMIRRDRQLTETKSALEYTATGVTLSRRPKKTSRSQVLLQAKPIMRRAINGGPFTSSTTARASRFTESKRKDVSGATRAWSRLRILAIWLRCFVTQTIF